MKNRKKQKSWSGPVSTALTCSSFFHEDKTTAHIRRVARQKLFHLDIEHCILATKIASDIESVKRSMFRRNQHSTSAVLNVIDELRCDCSTFEKKVFQESDLLPKHVAVAYAPVPLIYTMTVSSTPFNSFKMKTIKTILHFGFRNVHFASFMADNLIAQAAKNKQNKTTTNKTHTFVADSNYKSAIDREAKT